MSNELSIPAHWRNAIRDSDLDRTTKLVAYVLSTYMSRAGEAFPSKGTLAAGAGLGNRRSVDVAVDKLEASGFVTIVRSRGRRSFRYCAAPASLNGAAAARLHDLNGASAGSQRRSAQHPTAQALRPKAVESERESVTTLTRKKPRVTARDFSEYDR